MRSTPNKLTSGTYKSGTVRVRLSRDDPNRMAGLRNDSRIASRRVGRHLCADRDSRPSSLRASTYIRGADCDHGHGVRVVMGQRRCPFRPARVPERRFSQRDSTVLARGAVGAVRDSTQYRAALASSATAHLGARRRIRAGVLSRRCGAGGRSFQDPAAALVVVATGWAIILPAALAIASHWDGVTHHSPAPTGADDMNDARAG